MLSETRARGWCDYAIGEKQRDAPRVPVGIARFKTYVIQYVDPNWDTPETDVEVIANVEKVEIVLRRKAGGASDSSPKKSSTPD